MQQDSEMFQFLMKFYRNGEYENPRFFRRLENPDISGLQVLEVGCGTGSLAVFMADKLNAQNVLGLDLDNANIDFARSNLEYNHPDLAGVVDYRASTCRHLLAEPERFDCIVSKDSFEHIIAFEETFDDMWQLLKPGGRLMAGFGPLYYSPDGGHALTVFPGDHILLPEKWVLKRYNRRKKANVASVFEYGLNKMTLEDYLKVFKKYDPNPEFLKFNQSDKIAGKIMAALCRLPLLKSFTFNIYLILRKPHENQTNKENV